jgi:hypothetical protein
MPASLFTVTLPRTNVEFSFQYIRHDSYIYLQDTGNSILTSTVSASVSSLVQFTANDLFLSHINAEIPYKYFAYEEETVCKDPGRVKYTLFDKKLEIAIQGDMSYFIPITMSAFTDIPSVNPVYTRPPPGPRKTTD